MNDGLRRMLSAIAMGVILAATLAACGTVDDEAKPTVTREEVEGAPPTRTATPEGGATPIVTEPVASPEPGGESPPPDGGGASTSIEVDMVDIAFDPKEITIPANTDVTVNLVNKGALPHNFSIEGEADSGEIPGGGTVSVMLNLAPGTYEYFCNIPGHKEAGMVGTLIVT